MRIFILFISLLSALSLFSQSENGERVLSAKCAIQQTMGGVGYWQVSITNFSDPGGQVDATAIDTLDYVQFSDSGTPYALEVIGVVSAVGNTATVKLSNVGITGISSVPTTSNATWSRRTENFGLTPWPANITGNDAQLNQEYTMYKIDSILGTFSAVVGYDYVTTDSFTTFIGGHTFASIATNKTVFRTTTGSVYQKTSSTAMTRRSMDNGLLATTISNTSNDSIQFNANLNNRVQMTTGNVANAYVLNPLNYQVQTVGETFVIGVQAGTSDVTVNWGSVYGVYTGTSFNTMPTTVVPAQSIMTFTFRVITTSSEVIRFHYTDNISIASASVTGAQGVIDSSGVVQLGNPTSVSNATGKLLRDRYLNLNGKSLNFGDASNTLLSLFGSNDSLYASVGGIRIDLDGSKFLHTSAGGGGAGINENLYLGYQAGAAHTGTGYANTGIGRRALNALNGTAGDASSNVAVGYNAMAASTTSALSTALGTASLSVGTDLDGSVAVGHHAGLNSTGDGNLFLGQLSGENSGAGNENVFAGQSSGHKNTVNQNTGLGAQTLFMNVTGIENVAVGYAALQSSTSSENVAVGWGTLQLGAGGGFNTAVGNRALRAATTGNTNTAIGRQALVAVTTGSGNTAIGKGAGTTTTTGGSNIFIGVDVNGSSSSANNEANIGNSIFATSINALTSKWGINVPSAAATAPAPAAALDVRDWTGIQDAILYPLVVTTQISGAVATNGAGTGMKYRGENGAGNLVDYALTETVTTDVTASSEDAFMRHRSMLNGTVTDLWSASHTQFTAKNYVFNVDQTVGAGQDNYVLTYDHATGEIGLEAASIGGGTPWLLGGQNVGANANIGSNDAFRVGIATNGTPRTYWDASGRLTCPNITDLYLVAADSAKLEGDNSYIEFNTGFTRLNVAGTNVMAWNNTDKTLVQQIPDNTIGAISIQGTDGNSYFTVTSTNAAPRMVLGSSEAGAAVGVQGIRYEDVQSITSTGSFTATKSTIAVNLASTGTVTADLTGWPTSTTVASNLIIVNVDAVGAGVDVTVALTGATWHSGSNPVLTPGQSVNCKLINGVLYPL